MAERCRGDGAVAAAEVAPGETRRALSILPTLIRPAGTKLAFDWARENASGYTAALRRRRPAAASVFHFADAGLAANGRQGQTALRYWTLVSAGPELLLVRRSVNADDDTNPPASFPMLITLSLGGVLLKSRFNAGDDLWRRRITGFRARPLPHPGAGK